jgi:ubiquinone/menaquinone biosynthesis C-methylase UbiE
MLEKTRDYYDRTAEKYDQLHGGDDSHEHIFALERSWPILSRSQPESAVDVGCGTGRSLAWMQKNHDRSLDLIGVDPSDGLLKLARERLDGVEFVSGSGEDLPLEDESVDLAVATGIMHHVDSPEGVIREMFRVAKKAVLISDHNNFAFRGARSRKLRLWLHASGVLDFATYVKQGFRKQGYSEDDGWWYPYSLLNDFGLISSLSA